jgi:very-short-patch-repair endonuclease
MAQRNWPVRIFGKRKRRWVDVAIVEKRVGLEYDGMKPYAKHFTPEGRKLDKIRDAELADAGWRIHHVNKFNWKFFMAHMRDIIEGRMKLPTKVEEVAS